ncbi:MAG: phosphatidylglycerophosphatase A [Halomonadaceae bacterium]|nr:MAG: phosphatidylglycerophosphatase A [Halomonadaceae bacterium]
MSDASSPTISPRSLLRHPVHLLSLGLGSGCMRKAPGTWGTVAAVPLYGLIVWLPSPAYLLLLVLTFVVGIWLCGRTAEALGVHDHPAIVWDEFVGLWIALALQPTAWEWILLAFLLFRFFDILKPWPISWLDRRVSGGLGIMIDDVLAGLLALAAMVLVQLLLPGVLPPLW